MPPDGSSIGDVGDAMMLVGTSQNMNYGSYFATVRLGTLLMEDGDKAQHGRG